MLDTVRRSIFVFLALLLVFSSVMTETFCWQTQQLSTNIVTGRADEPGGGASPDGKAVELIKLEKKSDGTLTEKPIAGTAFMLFKENGEQVGARYTTDENGKITVSLKNGKYYFEEVAPSIGYTYDTENGEKITRYPFAISGNRYETTVVKAYNIRLDGSLFVRKTVENGDGSELTDMQKKIPFEFTVVFSDGGAYTYHIDGNEEEKLTLESGGVLELAHGQTAVFENVPVGVLYNITEKPAAGYVTTSSGHRGNITEDGAAAEFINRCDTNELGSLTVTKEAVGAGASAGKEFAFTATVGGETHEFTLRHGESKTFAGLPMGTKYTVTEANPAGDGYTPTVKEYTGHIAEGEELRLPFVNVHDELPEGKTGAVSVEKAVTGEGADADKAFTFEIAFEGAGAPEAEVFTLKAGERKVFEDIPYGVTYTVRETDAAGYAPAIDAVSGAVAGEQTAKVTFKNAAPDKPGGRAKLTVTKRLAGAYGGSGKETEFAFVLTVNGEKTEFTLKADETKEFDVPTGARYEVSEADYFSHGYIQRIANGAGIADSKKTEVIVTNSRHSSYEWPVVISGEKTWSMGANKDAALPESITVRLKNGELLIEERTVSPDENGRWRYSFTAPKYNRDGSAAVYTVEEAPIDGYSPSYSGYNIVNTYVEPISADPPVIRKVVTGEGAPEEEFTFIVKGANGAPMPEGSEGSVKKMVYTGAGELEIGEISFSRPGVYVYTVTERQGSAEGWIYDQAVYTITFTVTEKDGRLHAERVIKKNDEACEELVFTNVFDKSRVTNNVVISGTKTWEHGANPESKRPAAIVVYVYGDGKLVAQRQVTAKDGWRYAFTLPRIAEDGHEIAYRIDEAAVSGYSKTVNGYNLTNTYTGKRGNTPQTGDSNGLLLWFMLMIASGLGIIIAVVCGRRRKKSDGNG